MPKIIRNLDAEAAKHINSERKISMPKDFYARAGLSKINQEDVCAQWLVFRKVIFLNDESLEQIFKISRQKLLLKLLTGFLQHPDPARRRLRVDALHFVHNEMFDSDSRIISSDEELSLNYAGAILDKLAARNYGEKKIVADNEFDDFTTDRFISKPIAKNILPSVDAINGIFKRAFIHLTNLDTIENQLNDLKLILREKLFRIIEPEVQKKALMSFILQYCYDGGLFFMLHRAHKSNLLPNMLFNVDEDFKQATINFVTTDEATIEIYEQTPISLVETATEEYRSQLRYSYQSSNEREDSQTSEIDSGDEQDPEEKKDELRSVPRYLNALETQVAHTLEIDRNGVVVPRPLHALTRIYNQAAFDLVTAAWKTQLEEVAGYAESFILKRGHNEKAITRLMRVYPHLRNESPQLDPLRIMSIFSHAQAVAYKGDQIINFFGRNCSPEALDHLLEELHSYVRDEHSFKFAIQLLRRMGHADKIAEDFRPYAVRAGLSNPQALSTLTLTSEKTIQKLYPVLKPHDLYLVYKLLPTMKFTRATVIVQNPLSLVQFDIDGEKTNILDQTQLLDVFGKLNYSFYLNKDLATDAGLRSAVLDFTPAHLEIIKLAISRGRGNFKLTQQKLIYADKPVEPLPDAGGNAHESALKDMFVFTQHPAKLVYIDSSYKNHDLLIEKGVTALLEALNFKYYLTDLVWLDSVTSLLTNFPIEVLRQLDIYIQNNDGASILEDMGYFKMPTCQVIKEPGFVSLGKPLAEKVEPCNEEKQQPQSNEGPLQQQLHRRVV